MGLLDFSRYLIKDAIGRSLKHGKGKAAPSIFARQLLTGEDETLRPIAKERHYLQTPGHPAKKLFRRVLDRLLTECAIR